MGHNNRTVDTQNESILGENLRKELVFPTQTNLEKTKEFLGIHKYYSRAQLQHKYLLKI